VIVGTDSGLGLERIGTARFSEERSICLIFNQGSSDVLPGSKTNAVK